MNAMNRRAFIGRAAALTATALTPIPRAMAMIVPNSAPLKWFACGNDEFLYPYLDTSIEGAIRQYVIEYGATVGECCPECDEEDCTEHNDDLDAPAPWIEENSFEFDGDIPVDRNPSSAEWVKAGCSTFCDVCEYDEPTACNVIDGKAVCDDCLSDMRNTSKEDAE